MTQIISYIDSKRATAAAAAGTVYSLKMSNQSAQNWTFYVYQKEPTPSSDRFSLAWFASPYVITIGNSITFEWEISYNFVWSDTGLLIPGVRFNAGGPKPANPNGNNSTIFSLDPGPNLSDPIPGQPRGSLIINDAIDVPNNKFSVGIGMSGAGTFAVQAGPSLTHQFTPTPSYWVAAGSNIRVGTVLNIQTITQTEEAKFGPGVFDLVATLDENNQWTIEDA